MTLQELSSKYIQKSERVLSVMQVHEGSRLVEEKRIRDVVAEAKRYLQDAKFYLGAKRFETSLASIAYCEGLLDALRLLGLVDFMW